MQKRWNIVKHGDHYFRWDSTSYFFVAATNIAGFIAEFWIIIFQAKVDLGLIFAKKLK